MEQYRRQLRAWPAKADRRLDMSKRGRKRKARKKNAANGGKRPNA